MKWISGFARITLLIMTMPVYADKTFLDQRYRGWLWFEEKASEPQKLTAAQAEVEIEILKQEMDNKRSVMIARPTAESVRDYVELEDIMWKRAIALDRAYRDAKFLYPALFDKLREPTNVHAVKFKRKLEQDALYAKIRDFATKFDLVLFSKGSCSYCKEFAPILKRFSDMYGFRVEEASIDGIMSGLFEGKQEQILAKDLGIESTPTVIVISKDGTHVFELIRGYVTISELEEYAGLAAAYYDRLTRDKV